MPPRFPRRLAAAAITAVGLLCSSACRSEPDTEKPSAPARSSSTAPATPPATLKNEIPPDALEAVMKAHFDGVGRMEQYQYGKAVESFRTVHKLAPGWIPGSINLAIALLNDAGVQAEEAKKAGGAAPLSNFDAALELLAGVLDRDPDNPYAHYSRGIILEQDGKILEAHRHFRRVTEIDPTNASAWYWLASTVTDPNDPARPPGPEQAKDQIVLLNKAIELNPYLTPALYKLAVAYRMAGQPAKQKDLLDRWKKINPDRQEPVPGPGESGEKVYGEMGKYATAIDPFHRPTSSERSSVKPPSFEAAKTLNVKLAEGVRWAKATDFDGPKAVIGRIRDRFGAAIAAFDADGDGRLDLYLASAVVGKKGVRDALLLNRGEARFEEASASFGLPEDRASVGVAAADFDSDRYIDVFLTGVGDNRLLRNRDGKAFEDVSRALKTSGSPALSLTARWLDLDQDGDLDLYVVNYCPADQAEKAFLGAASRPAGATNAVYRNDGRPDPIPGSPEPAWAPWPSPWRTSRRLVGSRSS